MIEISLSAQEHFKKLLKKQDKDSAIRVFVQNPGTVNAKCGVAYCAIDEITLKDEVFKDYDFELVIIKSDIDFLVEAKIDLEVDPLGDQLTLKAPHAKAGKLKKNASLKERLEFFINANINPNLASHGGFIELLKIEKKVATITFGGGCNGCSMVGSTLKDGVEGEILSNFKDEITQVVDSTEHQSGEHSYY